MHSLDRRALSSEDSSPQPVSAARRGKLSQSTSDLRVCLCARLCLVDAPVLTRAKREIESPSRQDTSSPPILQVDVDTEASDEVNESPKLSEAQLNSKVSAILDDLFCSGEVEDAAISIKELQSPDFHPEFINKALTISCEKKEKEQDLLRQLVSALNSADTLTNEQLIKGYAHHIARSIFVPKELTHSRSLLLVAQVFVVPRDARRSGGRCTQGSRAYRVVHCQRCCQALAAACVVERCTRAHDGVLAARWQGRHLARGADGQARAARYGQVALGRLGHQLPRSRAEARSRSQQF